jgi:integrase
MVIVEAQPRLGDFVFSVNGNRPISYGRAKRSFIDTSGVSNWRLHDLRRTSRTLLSRAGISPDVAERCLGHVIPGVRGTYDRHSFYKEKVHAFEALAALLERIVHPPEGDVVTPLRRGARS